MAPIRLTTLFCLLLVFAGAAEIPAEEKPATENAAEEKSVSQQLETEAIDRAIFQQIMTASMQQPETRQRLIEVMPLLRSLTRSQRHALADMLQKVSRLPRQGTQAAQIAGASLPTLLPELDVVSLLQNGESEAQREAEEEAKLKAIEAIAALPQARSFDTAAELNETMPEELPQALESRWKMTPEEFMAFLAEHRKFQTMAKRRRVQQSATRVSVGLRPPPLPKGEECDLFSNTLCLEVPNYPKEAIIASMKRSTTSMLGVLAREIGTEQTSDRRQDVEENLVGVDNEKGATLCPSITKYARPKRARNVNGQWKYLVNTGDEHSQTLRIELCTEAGESCNYLANGVASQCVQVYTHHRLLAWDYDKGLFLDLFKVPTCCSCHVQPAYGPALFPPATTPKPRRSPAPFDAEPEYMEDDDTDSSSIVESHNPPRPMRIPVPWPTKSTLAAKPVRPPFGKNGPLKPATPAPVHETHPQQPTYAKQPPKRLRPSEKLRPDLDEAGATATHRRRRPPSERSKESLEAAEDNSRINYSYHPIIDFFRNEERAKQQHQQLSMAERRTSSVHADDDWRPIEPSYRVPVRRF